MKERGDNMRILVISDSHGQLGNLNEILKEAGKVDRVIHLGDAVGQDEEIREMCGCPVTIVRGNCDFYSKNELVEIVEEENVKILVEQFIQEINTLRSEIKELKDNQNVSRAELLEKIDNMKYEEKLNEINEKLQEKETKNNIISFETLKRKKSNKKVFNINEESIGFEDLQRLSNCIVDLNDEVTSLEAMSN